MPDLTNKAERERVKAEGIADARAYILRRLCQCPPVNASWKCARCKALDALDAQATEREGLVGLLRELGNYMDTHRGILGEVGRALLARIRAAVSEPAQPATGARP